MQRAMLFLLGNILQGDISSCWCSSDVTFRLRCFCVCAKFEKCAKPRVHFASSPFVRYSVVSLPPRLCQLDLLKLYQSSDRDSFWPSTIQRWACDIDGNRPSKYCETWGGLLWIRRLNLFGAAVMQRGWTLRPFGCPARRALQRGPMRSTCETNAFSGAFYCPKRFEAWIFLCLIVLDLMLN